MITALIILSVAFVLVSGLLFVNMRKFRYHMRCKVMLDALKECTILPVTHERLAKNVRAIDEMPFSQLFILYAEADDWKKPLEIEARDGE